MSTGDCAWPTAHPGEACAQPFHEVMAGVGSRRVCEDLIAEGRVLGDGEVAELGRRVDAETARITRGVSVAY